MTTEAVLLNCSAVALAADSAITLQGNGAVKISNSGEKLFQLCKDAPVAVMFFGSTEFMGVPFEVLIAKFAQAHEPRRKLSDYADEFFRFLEANDCISQPLRDAHLGRLVDTLVFRLRDRFASRVAEFTKSNQRIGSEMLPQWLREEISAMRDEIEEEIDSDIHSKIPIDEFGSVRKLIRDWMDKQEPKELIFGSAHEFESFQRDITDLVLLFLRKDIFTNMRTGIVFSGYGEEETYPRLRVYDTEGILAGRVKRRLVETVDIEPESKRAHVASMAQDDVIKAYIEGFAPAILDDLRDAFYAALRTFGAKIAPSHARGKKRSHLENAAAEATTQLMTVTINQLQMKQRNEMEQVLQFMSKREMARFAESLIDITALRRRVTLTAETVGGPVDVVVISRGTGFTWIKRKA